MTRAADSLARLKAELADHADQLLVELFGEPTTRRKHEWRWEDGAVAYYFERQQFFDFRRDRRAGSLLDAIILARVCDFAAAKAFAVEWLTGKSSANPRQTFHAKAENDDRCARARATWAAGQNVHGTAAKLYLEYRGMDASPDYAARFITAHDVPSLTGWPYWRWPAIMFQVIDAAGDVQAVQLVALRDDGTPVLLDPDSKGRRAKLKQSLGPVGQGMVRFHGDVARPLCLSEGAETGLAVNLATNFETWANLGVISTSIDLSTVPLDRLIVVAADDDPMHPMSPSMKSLSHAVKTWRREGRHVVEVYPYLIRRYDKSDHADLLKQLGIAAVRERFAFIDGPQPMPDYKPVPADVARTRLVELTRDIIDRLLAIGWRRDDLDNPPAALLASTIGLGKSFAALTGSIDLIGKGTKPIAIATPTHKLNRELLQRARTMVEIAGGNVRVEMRLGRQAIDPEGDGESRMCFDLGAVQAVESVGLDAQSHVCERKRKDGTTVRCRHFDPCPFQRQRRQIADADIVLVSHAALAHSRPAEIAHPALLVIDENPVNAFLRGTNAAPGQQHDAGWISIGVAALDPVVRNRAGADDAVRTAGLEADYPELVGVRRKLAEVRTDNGPGPIRRDLLVGLATDELRKAAGQAKARIIHSGDIIPGMPSVERLELLKGMQGNKLLLHEARLYELLAAFLENEAMGPSSGHVRIAQTEQHQVWRLTYLAKLASGWRAPALLLDATARPDYRIATKKIFPGLRDEFCHQVRAASPYRRVTLVTGRSMSKQRIASNPEANARQMAVYAAIQARYLGGGQALLTGNKILTDAANGICPNLGLAHFNALRGLDVYREARVQVIVGRSLPPPEAVETIAGAISGRAVDPLPGWYERLTKPVVVEGEVVATVDGLRHPDELAEAVRWQACEGEILQAERLRGVERTAETPADLMLVGCPLPDELTIDRVVAWEAPGPVEQMLVRGVVFRSGTHAAKAYSDLWSSAETAKKSLRGSQQRWGNISYEEYYRKLSPTSLLQVAYKLAGAGARPAVALVDLDLVHDPRSWLEDRLGPLASLEPEIVPQVRARHEPDLDAAKEQALPWGEALNWLARQMQAGIPQFAGLEPVDPSVSPETKLHDQMLATWRDARAWHLVRHDLAADLGAAGISP
jgi:putative DNA primase/helicase